MSRNVVQAVVFHLTQVTSREGRVSRNQKQTDSFVRQNVTSREGRVSRNPIYRRYHMPVTCHVPRGACE